MNTTISKENARAEAFAAIWNNDIDPVFSDVAKYYDRANDFASLGLISNMRRRFVTMIDVQSNFRCLDVCAGTNAIGIQLLKKEPTLDIHAVDRSVSMQEVGKDRARKNGFEIKSFIHDVHKLPFPDNHFDVVTIQWATRHLRVLEVFPEILRVLKPGGHFYHCDMLRPANKIVEQLYYLYLKACLNVTSLAFRSDETALNCRKYFIKAIQLFYSADELSRALEELGFTDVISKPILCGMVAFHNARKP